MNKGLIYSEQLTLFGKPTVTGYSNGTIAVREIPREKANEVIKREHYSHKVFGASFIHLGVYDSKGAFVGVLQYGCAMNPASGGGSCRVLSWKIFSNLTGCGSTIAPSATAKVRR